MPTVDEMLGAIAEVGLRLWILCDNGAEGWYCVTHDVGNVANQHAGNGATAVEAMVASLKNAGIEIDD